RRDADDAGPGEEIRDLADAPDVLATVLGGKSEILAETVAGVVAVDDGCLAGMIEEAPLQFGGDGALARGAQAGEPDDATAVPVAAFAQLAGDAAGAPEDVLTLVLPVGGAARVVVVQDDAASADLGAIDKDEASGGDEFIGGI